MAAPLRTEQASLVPRSPSPDTYRNPVLAGFYPDPSICRVGDSFYLVTSSFEYFPGIPVFRSTDLVTWRQVGHCLTRDSQLDLRDAPASGGIFAATIRWHDGRFFVTSTNVSSGGHFVVHAEDPAGPWSDPVWVDQDGIDPSLFFENGDCYFTSSVEPEPAGEHVAQPSFRRGAQQSLIDPVTGARLTDVRFLWEGTGGRFPEAPHLFRHGDHYFLLLAEGGTESGHMVTIARSTTPWGPWEGCPRNPIVSHRSLPSAIQATGHADLVELADGSWWMVLLGVRPVGPFHHLGRETFLAPVTWDAAGWPVVGRDGEILEHDKRPALPMTLPLDDGRTVDDFSGPELPPRWNTLRRPLTPAEASLSRRPGALTLVGGPASTDDPLLVFVGRRQQHFSCVVEATLEYSPTAGEEAGLTVRMDEQHHVDVAVQRVDGVRSVILRRRIGSLAVTAAVSAVDDGPLTLRVDADARWYRFSVVHGNGRHLDLGAAETRYLSAEVAGGFTGVYIGMYASAGSSRAATPAYWRRFEYTPGS